MAASAPGLLRHRLARPMPQDGPALARSTLPRVENAMAGRMLIAADGAEFAGQPVVALHLGLAMRNPKEGPAFPGHRPRRGAPTMSPAAA